MRNFQSDDGLKWHVWVQDTPGAGVGTGWENVLFDSEGAVQRLVHRPAGWLARASDRELRTALGESEAIRACWGCELTPV